MPNYSIRPIALCAGPRDVSQYTYFSNYGMPCTSVCYSWYIDGSEPKTLVDTGLVVEGPTEAWSTVYCSHAAGLARLGLKPEDIEVVIVTHLHADHIGGGSLFTRARFVVQETELEYACNPHPIDAFTYERDRFEHLDMVVINGPKDIAPGVSVFCTPGHSPGGQSVEIDTRAGKAIITGFCCELSTFKQTEAMAKRAWQVSAPLLHHDVRQAYDSVLAVKKRADIIIAAHDPVYVDQAAIP